MKSEKMLNYLFAFDVLTNATNIEIISLQIF